jgi:hypothetical protein
MIAMKLARRLVLIAGLKPAACRFSPGTVFPPQLSRVKKMKINTTVRKRSLLLFFSLMAIFLPHRAKAQYYEIRHDTVDSFGWFGGDNRPGQMARSVGVGQSVLIDTAMTVERCMILSNLIFWTMLAI